MKKIAAVVLIAMSLGACAVPAEESTVKQAGKAKPTTSVKQARTVWGNGTYKVGSEIKPGQYRTKGNPDGLGCYWERLRGTSGEIEDVIANDTPTGPSTFTVKKTDKYIKFMLDCEWTRVK